MKSGRIRSKSFLTHPNAFLDSYQSFAHRFVYAYIASYAFISNSPSLRQGLPRIWRVTDPVCVTRFGWRVDVFKFEFAYERRFIRYIQSTWNETLEGTLKLIWKRYSFPFLCLSTRSARACVTLRIRHFHLVLIKLFNHSDRRYGRWRYSLKTASILSAQSVCISVDSRKRWICISRKRREYAAHCKKWNRFSGICK